MNKKKVKKILKNKRLIIFLILLIILIVCMILLKGVFFPGGGSNYGNRLDGIEKISFTKKNRDSVTKFLEENEKVISSKMNIHGKIINVLIDVNTDVTVDEAKNIANSSLEKFSDEVKEFYDIQFIITNSKEVGEEVQSTDANGNTVTNTIKKFPIMGYKNSSNNAVVW